MNRSQCRVLSVGLLLLAITTLFPPRRYTQAEDYRAPQRGFLFYDVRVEERSSGGKSWVNPVTIDWEHLATEWAAVIFTTASVLWWLRSYEATRNDLTRQ